MHEVANALGPQKSLALTFFHAVTGCDTVSAFTGKGKKSAWDAWNCCTESLDAFQSLASKPPTIGLDLLAVCERFVVLLYDRTSSECAVNVARKTLFCRGNRPISHVPPTQDALLQHVKRAAFQAGFVWAQSIVAWQSLPSPSDWGWQCVDNVWHPVWMTLPPAADCCPELVSCGCKAGCTTKRCKCVRANLSCTALCNCQGECNREDDTQ